MYSVQCSIHHSTMSLHGIFLSFHDGIPHHSMLSVLVVFHVHQLGVQSEDLLIKVIISGYKFKMMQKLTRLVTPHSRFCFS